MVNYKFMVETTLSVKEEEGKDPETLKSLALQDLVNQIRLKTIKVKFVSQEEHSSAAEGEVEEYWWPDQSQR